MLRVAGRRRGPRGVYLCAIFTTRVFRVVNDPLRRALPSIIAERLSVRQIILHRISRRVCIYVCVYTCIYVSRLGMRARYAQT